MIPDFLIYYDTLFKYLQVLDLLPSRGQQYRRGYLSSVNEVGFDYCILKILHNRYNDMFDNVVLTNCYKNILLCEQFNLPMNTGLVECSVCYSLLGCVFDYMMDHGTKDERILAKHLLQKDTLTKILNKEYKLKHELISCLFSKIVHGLDILKSVNAPMYQFVFDCIVLSAYAETASVQRDISDETIINKSVLFIKTAQYMIFVEREPNNKENCLISNIGNLFAIVDDLCDVYEDVYTGQGNIVINNYLDIHNEKKTVDTMVNRMINYLNNIKESANGSLYDFLLSEVKEWFVICPQIRERLLKNG